MPPFTTACLAYLSVALPSSTLGLLWPAMRLSLHEPVGTLGVLLAFSVTASVVSSAATGRLLARFPMSLALAAGTMLTAVALAVESLAPSLLVMTAGTVIFGLGFGTIDAALNVYAARHFGARQINWMHASYGLGATVGPLLVTVLLADGVTWRWTYGAMAVAQAAVAGIFILARPHWERPPLPAAGPLDRADGLSARAAELLASADGSVPGADRHAPGADRHAPGADGHAPAPPGHARRRRVAAAAVAASAFAAVETGIESAAGIWGYIFLTAGHGLPHEAAGAAVSAYWATMFAGRAVLGPVAQRFGAGRVLAGAIAGVIAGAALLTVPAPHVLAMIGLLVIGLAAAPIFPLLTLTTARRTGTDVARTSRTVSRQVAASAAGGALLPAGIGLAIGAFSASALAPALLALSLALATLYGLLARPGNHS